MPVIRIDPIEPLTFLRWLFVGLCLVLTLGLAWLSYTVLLYSPDPSDRVSASTASEARPAREREVGGRRLEPRAPVEDGAPGAASPFLTRLVASIFDVGAAGDRLSCEDRGFLPRVDRCRVEGGFHPSRRRSVQVPRAFLGHRLSTLDRWRRDDSAGRRQRS